MLDLLRIKKEAGCQCLAMGCVRLGIGQRRIAQKSREGLGFPGGRGKLGSNQTALQARRVPGPIHQPLRAKVSKQLPATVEARRVHGGLIFRVFSYGPPASFDRFKRHDGSDLSERQGRRRRCVPMRDHPTAGEFGLPCLAPTGSSKLPAATDPYPSPQAYWSRE